MEKIQVDGFVSRAPSRPVGAAAVAGTPIAVLLGWALSVVGVDVPPGAGEALGAIVGAVVGYFTRGGRKGA